MEQFKIIIPKQTEMIKKSIRDNSVGDHNLWCEGWTELPSWKHVRVGDILRMRAIRKDNDGYETLVENHIGVIIEPLRVMHTSETLGVLVDKIDVSGFSWRCIKGYRCEK